MKIISLMVMMIVMVVAMIKAMIIRPVMVYFSFIIILVSSKMSMVSLKVFTVTVGTVVCCLDIGFRHTTTVPIGKYYRTSTSLNLFKTSR